MCTWRKLTHLSQSSCNPEWNKHARSFWFYSFSSCAISLLGLTLFMTSWRNTAFFIVFQSFVSYCADVHHCGRPSIFHGIDHWAAVGTGSLFANFLIFSVNECISSHQKLRAASLVAVAAGLESASSSIQNVFNESTTSARHVVLLNVSRVLALYYCELLRVAVDVLWRE